MTKDPREQHPASPPRVSRINPIDPCTNAYLHLDRAGKETLTLTPLNLRDLKPLSPNIPTSLHPYTRNP